VRDMTIEKELIHIRPFMGADISTTIREALILSLQEKCQVTFMFNDTPVTANANPLVDVIYAEWATKRGK